MREYHQLIENLPSEYKAFVISQVDPFHDDPIDLRGAPSSLSSSSAMLTLKQETTITAADFSITTPGAKWAVNIAMFPNVNEQATYSGLMTGPATINCGGVPAVTQSPQATLFPLTFSAVEHTAGNETTYTHDPASAVPVFQGLSNSAIATYTDGDGYIVSRLLRMVGCAFEVVNETPDIYQQGSVTVYEYPNVSQNTRVTAHWVGSGLNQRDEFCQVRTMAMPPTNLASATINPNSKTWKAKDGCYVIGRPTKTEQHFRRLMATPILYVGNKPTVGDTEPWNYAFITKTGVNLYPAPSNVPLIDTVFDYNVSGAYFQGLSVDYGTLRVRYKTFWEIVPSVSDSTLVPLARPTLVYRSDVAQLVEEIFRKMPVGVPQTWNPKGEMWRKILSVVGEIATASSPIISALNPEVGALVATSGATATAASKVGQKKKKAKPKPKPKAKGKRAA